jgi:hypothetical protein
LIVLTNDTLEELPPTEVEEDVEAILVETIALIHMELTKRIRIDMRGDDRKYRKNPF